MHHINPRFLNDCDHLYSEVARRDGVRIVDAMDIKNCELFDARSKAEDLSLINILYTVHLVMVDGKASYHASLVAADNGNETKRGVTMAADSIIAKLGSDGISASSIEPVFIRNLFADNPKVAISCEEGGIASKLDLMLLSNPDPLRFVVLGLMVDDALNEELLLEEVKADDAAGAIEQVEFAVKDQTGRNFIPMFSTIKTPLTDDLMARFQDAAGHFVAIVEASPTHAAKMH